MTSYSSQRIRSALLVNGTLALLVLIWMIPTIGLFVSSFRNREDIQSSPWWNILPHREWQVVEELDPQEQGLDATQPMDVFGVTATFEELRAGVDTPDGKRVQWIGNRRLGRIEVQEQVWAVSTDFSLANYVQVLQGKDFEYVGADGTVEIVPGDNFSGALFNSIAGRGPGDSDSNPDRGLRGLWVCLDELPGA